MAAVLFAALSTPFVGFAKQYEFKLYSEPEGLRNQVINCLAQDRKGFLWVGTENGLYRYDGFKFAFFGRANGLPDETIQSLHVSWDGTLWVGTRLGVAKWDGTGFSADPVLGATELFGHSNIVSDSRGAVYVGTGRGLAVLEKAQSDKSRFRFLTKEAVFGVYVEQSGTVWFSANGTLWKLRDGAPARVSPQWNLPDDRWDSMVLDRAGNFWIRSSERLMLRRRGAQTFDAVPGIPHSPEFGFVYEAPTGDVLVPTVGGLMRYSLGHWEKIGFKQGLVSDESTCLLQDREGSVWVGLGGEGLERWIGFEEWESWNRTDGLASNIIWDLERDADGRMWVATEEGLNVQDSVTGDWLLKGLSGLSVRTVLDDPRHHAMWYGANPGGVFRLDRNTGKIRQFGKAAGLRNTRIDKLFFDAEGRLWATTRGGLYRGAVHGDKVRFEEQDIPYSDPNEAFFGYLFDRQGRLWIGGSRGLIELQDGQWRRFSKSDGLIGDGVSHVAETPDGAIWFGYLSNSGVTRLTLQNGRSQVTHFTTKNGLTSDGSVFVGADRRGWLWVGTDDGADVHTSSGWSHYGKADGLIWDDCDALAFHADPDGSVWIGTSGGLSRFHPLTPARIVLAPAAYITSIQSGKRFLSLSSPISLAYQDRSIAIDFASPTFLNETAVAFRYRMLGFEQAWVDTDERSIRYPNLPAGDYRFQVMARNARGRWSAEVASVPIAIRASWWQTWQFRTAVFVSLAGLFHQLWRLRIRYLLEKQERLESLLRQAQTADQQKSEALAIITRGETRERNRNRVLELIAAHQPLETVLAAIVEMVELDEPDTLCLILVLRDGHFHRGASGCLAEPFARSLTGSAVHSDTTCFALAAQNIETVYVEDVATGSLWHAHRDTLVHLGIASSRSAPIVSSGSDVLGTITFFRKRACATAYTESNVLGDAARLSSIAMEQLSLHEQLSYRAQYDTLTELPNRILFTDRLHQAIVSAERHGTKLGVVMVDLDGFKFVNDTFGHHAGDVLLQTVARRIRSCLRREDTAARMGGDEFTIIIETDDCADIHAVIKKLIDSIGQPVELGDREAFVTASVGVSVYPDHSRDPVELMKNADMAMYHVKKLGKNAHDFFAPEMAKAESGRMEMETHLRNALTAGEFFVLFQPQFTMDRRLSGFEALLRWTNPILGAVAPSRFIPLAEETGLIIPLGRWVLEEVCRQCAKWLASGFRDFRVAVNVSACQFGRDDFPGTVACCLKAAGIPPDRIELELTETALMTDVGMSCAQLHQLRDSGVSISIDDFGTGYSSLSYLHSLPVDSIKIDQSFVQSLGTGAHSMRMIKAIMNLAHDLELKVIAEGVETEEQLRCLKAVQCDFAQGYLLGKPADARTATSLLEKQRGERVGERKTFDEFRESESEHDSVVALT